MRKKPCLNKKKGIIMKWARVINEEGDISYISIGSDNNYYELEGEPLKGTLKITGRKISPQKWLTPVESPAIFCIGLNYRGHARETNKPIPEYPVVFMKNPSALTGHLEPIKIPGVCDNEVDYEGELVIIIKKDALNVKAEEAHHSIEGFTIGNDVSARKWQNELGGGQWVRGKSFDTFAPVGPFVLPMEDLQSCPSFQITTRVNNQIMQTGNTTDMIFNPFELVSFLSQDTTLKAGSLIFTGTPSGVGWARSPKIVLNKGDMVEIEIPHIGILKNPVV